MQGGGRYNPYPSNQSVATRAAAVQVQPNNIATNAYINVPGGYDCYNGLYGPGITRANYPAYPVNFDDEIYNGQSPAYMLPNNNESMLSTNGIFGPPASPRTWDVFSSSGRTQNSLYADQTPPTSLSLPNGSFSGTSIPFASNPNDIPSSLSSSSAMAASMTSLDRILPNPAMGRSQQPGLIVAGGNPLDGLAISKIGYRTSLPWAGSDALSCSSQSSDRVMSISYGSTVDSNGGSGDSSATTDDTSFSYVPISHSSPGAPMKAAATLAGSGRAEVVRRPNDSTTENRTGTHSQESTPSPENTIAEAYGYSGDMIVGRRSTCGSISSGTLSNGQTYTRLRPLPIPTSEMYRTSQQELAEYHSQLPHRTSIASLSSSARY